MITDPRYSVKIEHAWDHERQVASVKVTSVTGKALIFSKKFSEPQPPIPGARALLNYLYDYASSGKKTTMTRAEMELFKKICEHENNLSR